MGDHIADTLMPLPKPTEKQCREAVDLYIRIGNKAECARKMGIPRRTYCDWLETAPKLYQLAVPAKGGPQPKGRLVTELLNGTAIVAADFHYWPGEPSTGHRALVKLTRELQPDILVANGDVCDFSTISRHPPLGWTAMPTAAEEIEIAQDRLQEWAEAGGKAGKYWPVGNHDARMETFIASNAPELKGIQGTSLQDHFPLWEPCYSLFINDRPGGLVVTHRFKGGIHAPWNNVMNAGRSIATGHLHSQKVIPFTTYDMTLYGIDVGCIADPYSETFQYLEDSPRNWRSGFAVFTFEDGVLLPPELVTVLEPGLVYFRGKTIEV